MRRLHLTLFLAFGLVLTGSTTRAQEAIHLTVPITQPTLAVSDYVPVSLLITVRPTPTIVVRILGNDGRVETFSYPCAMVAEKETQVCKFTTDASVLTMITTLNTANLSTRSLWRRVFDRLVLDFPAMFSGGATVQ